MWRYIPYSMYDSKSVYYRLNTVLSYNKHINLLIGARGRGKTYPVKEYVIKHFIQNDEKFAWIRDNEASKDELVMNDGQKFYEDVPLMKIYGFKEGNIKHGVFNINGKNAGYVLPASTYQKYKGNSYESVKTIVYDEFIPEKGTRKNKNNLLATINTFSTIARHREDIKIFMMANALDRGDEFLEFLGVEINDFGLYINDEKSIIIHYIDNSQAFNEKVTKGVIGKLLVGTPLEDNILSSKFTEKSDLFFDSLPAKSNLMFILETNINKIRFYKSNNKLYVTPDYDDTKYLNKRYVLDIADSMSYKPPLDLKTKNYIKEMLKYNLIYFKNDFVKRVVVDVFS